MCSCILNVPKKTFLTAWSCSVTTLVCVQNPSPCRFFLIKGKLAQDCLLNPAFRRESPWVAPRCSKKPCLALAIIYVGALSPVGRVIGLTSCAGMYVCVPVHMKMRRPPFVLFLWHCSHFFKAGSPTLLEHTH